MSVNASGDRVMRFLLSVNLVLLLILVAINVFHFATDSRKQLTSLGSRPLFSSSSSHDFPNRRETSAKHEILEEEINEPLQFKD